MEDESSHKSADVRVFNPSTKAVLAALQAASGKKGACLSVGELAEIISRSQSTVRRALKVLAEAGLITINRHGGNYRNGGLTNCYQIDNPLSVIPDTPLSINSDNPLPFDNPLSSSGTPVEYAGAHVHAAREEEPLNKNTTTTTTTTAVVVVENQNARDDDKPLSEREGDLGEVARAFDRYMRGSMTGTSADTFTVLIEDYGAAKVVEAFKAAFGKKDPWGYAMWWLKNPQLVDKPKAVVPKPKQDEFVTRAEKEAARREFNFDVPEFSKIGSKS